MVDRRVQQRLQHVLRRRRECTHAQRRRPAASQGQRRRGRRQQQRPAGLWRPCSHAAAAGPAGPASDGGGSQLGNPLLSAQWCSACPSPRSPPTPALLRLLCSPPRGVCSSSGLSTRSALSCTPPRRTLRATSERTSQLHACTAHEIADQTGTSRPCLLAVVGAPAHACPAALPSCVCRHFNDHEVGAEEVRTLGPTVSERLAVVDAIRLFGGGEPAGELPPQGPAMCCMAAAAAEASFVDSAAAPACPAPSCSRGAAGRGAPLAAGQLHRHLHLIDHGAGGRGAEMAASALWPRLRCPACALLLCTVACKACDQGQARSSEQEE